MFKMIKRWLCKHDYRLVGYDEFESYVFRVDGFELKKCRKCDKKILVSKDKGIVLRKKD